MGEEIFMEIKKLIKCINYPKEIKKNKITGGCKIPIILNKFQMEFIIQTELALPNRVKNIWQVRNKLIVKKGELNKDNQVLIDGHIRKDINYSIKEYEDIPFKKNTIRYFTTYIPFSLNKKVENIIKSKKKQLHEDIYIEITGSTIKDCMNLKYVENFSENQNEIIKSKLNISIEIDIMKNSVVYI